MIKTINTNARIYDWAKYGNNPLYIVFCRVYKVIAPTTSQCLFTKFQNVMQPGIYAHISFNSFPLCEQDPLNIVGNRRINRWDNISRWNDSEMHHTVWLDCMTGEAGNAIQWQQSSAFHFISHTPGRSRFYHINIFSNGIEMAFV